MKKIAVIGIGCRFPLAPGKNDFWENLADGKDAVAKLPADRIEKSSLFGSMSNAVFENFYGGFLNDIENFDAKFFNISAREAPFLDPQQRLLLQASWEALEDAGIVPSVLKGSQTGVFIGVSTADYSVRFQNNQKIVTPYTGTGNALSITANRISYQFDFHGPSLAIDTACSSSLSAVHYACESLIRGESKMALAGGVNLILSPLGKNLFEQAGAMAKDGRCKAFDSRADGFVRSEGVGIVVLKSLEQAMIDGDRIYCVIQGSAVSQDGKTNGLMAPSRWAQEAAINTALREANFKPEEIEYVETHGTGTLLGDPIEAKALAASLTTCERNPLKIGSLKTSVGHMEAAAGIGNLIKVSLAMKNKLIPASLHFQQPNPYIPFKELKLAVQNQSSPWTAKVGSTRKAGISSFGFGGTNVHVVVESVEKPESGVVKSGPLSLFTLSAQSKKALKSYAERYLKSFEKNDFVDRTVYEVCRSTALTRTHHDHRISFVANDFQDIQNHLNEFVRNSIHLSDEPLLKSDFGSVWIFPGQGSQWSGMARQLYKEQPVFRMHLEKCDQEIKSKYGWSVIDELMDEKSTYGADIFKIQPILFSICTSLAELWKSWGQFPKAVVGHSMGEVAAAYVAGILSLKDAVRVICERSLLMFKLKGQGMMAVVEASRQETESMILKFKGQVSVGACNSSRSTVISGESSLVQEFVKELEGKGIFAKLIKVDVASHSSQVDSILSEIKIALNEICPQKSQIDFYSTVTGQLETGEKLTADYWCNNLRQPVLFTNVISDLMIAGARLFAEISPHPVLLHPIQHTGEDLLASKKIDGELGPVISLASLVRNEDEVKSMLRTLSALYMAGETIDWKKQFPMQGRFVDLPTYPFQDEKHWMIDEIDHLQKVRANGFDGFEIKGPDSRQKRVWEIRVSTSDFAFLKDHEVGENIIFPGAGFIEMVCKAADKIFENKQWVLENLNIRKPLFLDSADEHIIQLSVSNINCQGADFGIYVRIQNRGFSVKDSEYVWIEYASGALKIAVSEDSKNTPVLEQFNIKDLAVAKFYGSLAEMGNKYGPAFQGIKKLSLNDGKAFAEIEIPQILTHEIDKYWFHPAVLDACLQPLLGLVSIEKNLKKPMWPVSLSKIKIFNHGSLPAFSHSEIQFQNEEASVGNVQIYDRNQNLILDVEGIKFVPVEASQTFKPTFPRRKADWQYEMVWKQVDLSHTENGPEDWIIFADDRGIHKNFSDLLLKAGKRVLAVIDGLDDRNLHVLKNVLSQQTHLRATGLVILSSLRLDFATDYQSCQTRILELQNLLRRLDENQNLTKFHIWMATQGAQSTGVETSDDLNPYQAPFWGIFRSLLEEQPDRFKGIVDIQKSTNSNTEQTAHLLWSFIQNSMQEPQGAVRDQKIYVPRFVRIVPNLKESLPIKFSSKGTYLITGGLGNLGLSVAKWAIEKGARHLLIVGRSPVPHRSEWKKVSQTQPEFERIQSLLQLQDLGCQTTYIACDIANKQQIENEIKKYHEHHFPPIRGVFHIAGVVLSKSFTEMNESDLNSVLSPKIQGISNLNEIFNDKGLDFFVAFSSLSSQLSSPFLSVYAGANLFMDTLIHKRIKTGLKGTVVDWGTWAESAQTGQESKGTYSGIAPIDHSSGLRILEDCLSFGRSQLSVGIVNWEMIKSLSETMANSSMLKGLFEKNDHEDHLQKSSVTEDSMSFQNSLRSATNEERIAIVENLLVQIVAKVLRRTPIEIPKQKPLNTFGLDSMVALEIKNKVSRDTGVNMTVPFLLKGPTISETAEFVAMKLGEKSEEATSEDTIGIEIQNLSEDDLNLLVDELDLDNESTRKAS